MQDAGSRIISSGILPMIQPGGFLPRSIHAQTLNLIANILSFVLINKNYQIKCIIIYVTNYKIVMGVLRQFECSGLGHFVSNCKIKNVGRDMFVSADITMHYFIQSKL